MLLLRLLAPPRLFSVRIASICWQIWERLWRTSWPAISQLHANARSRVALEEQTPAWQETRQPRHSRKSEEGLSAYQQDRMARYQQMIQLASARDDTDGYREAG